MLSVISSVVLAVAAFVPGAEAGLSASSHASRSGTRTTSSGSYRRHRTRTSSVKCSSKATATSYADAASDFVSAMAGAIAIGCGHDLVTDWRDMYDHMRDHGKAFAFAHADATASAGCVSQGNAYGCAAAKGNAKAWAKAVLKVYASAWALAVNSCTCNKHDQIAIAADKGKAVEFEKLIAKVEAEASAKVCVRGNDRDYVSASSKCHQDIYAFGFAKAWAKALIDGECYEYHCPRSAHYCNSPQGADLEAEAAILAKATIDTWEYVDC